MMRMRCLEDRGALGVLAIFPDIQSYSIAYHGLGPKAIEHPSW